jgi:hypothetical protein
MTSRSWIFGRTHSFCLSPDAPHPFRSSRGTSPSRHSHGAHTGDVSASDGGARPHRGSWRKTAQAEEEAQSVLPLPRKRTELRCSLEVVPPRLGRKVVEVHVETLVLGVQPRAPRPPPGVHRRRDHRPVSTAVHRWSTPQSYSSPSCAVTLRNVGPYRRLRWVPSISNCQTLSPETSRSCSTSRRQNASCIEVRCRHRRR